MMLMYRFRPPSGYLISKSGSSRSQRRQLVCFRPLSGHLISKSVERYLMTTAPTIKFPSPLGASYFQIKYNIPYTILKESGFRPLSGHLISK